MFRPPFASTVLFVLLIGCLAAACAPKVIPVAPAALPPVFFPDFLRPTVPAALAAGPANQNEERGWQFLQGGDLRSAEREFELALETDPAFYPARASLGYVELARKDASAALPHFDRALEGRGDELSALVGRGRALLAL